MYRDNYTDFYFNNLHSSNFKVWITNSNDLQFNTAPTFSDTFTSPEFTNTRYYEGTKIEKQDFKVKLAAINITKQDWRAITEWLSPLQSGPLSFQWNRNHYYMVKITSAPSGTIWVKSKVDDILEDVYIVNFEITFSTIGDWAALGPIASIPILEVASGNSWQYNKIKYKAAERFKNDYHIPFLMTESPLNYEEEVNNETYFIYHNIGQVEIKNSSFLYYPVSHLLIKIQKEIDADTQVVSFKLIYKDIFNLNTINTIIINNEKYSTFVGMNCYLITNNEYESEEQARYVITNPSSFESYLSIVSNMYPFNLQLEEKNLILNLNNEEDKDKLSSFFYNSKNGIILYNGEVAQNVRHNGLLTFKDIQNNSLTLLSGRPEIIKVKLVSYNSNYPLQIETTAGEDEDIKLNNFVSHLRFKCTNSFKYDRAKNFVMTIFQNWPKQSNVYNKDAFDTKGYYDSTFNNITTINPSYSFKYENNNLFLDIYFVNNCKNYSIDMDDFENKFDITKYYFISICDCQEIILNSELEDDKYTLIDFQTRDVI